MTEIFISEELSLPESSNIESSITIENTRYHYMDNLRAIAMLAGIFFHAALAYSPMMQNLWLSADSQQSIILDSFAWFTHLFRMPLFFLISGFFALMLMEKRGISGFLKNRGMRILLPFIIFLPLVITSFIVLIGWSIANVESQSPMLQFIAATYANPDIPQPPFSTTHLWFLFNLGLFCLSIALLKKWCFFESKTVKKLLNGKYMLLVLPLILVPAIYSQSAPLPAAERIYPELWSFGFYGLFFLFGALIYRNQNLLEAFKKYHISLFVFSLLAYSVLYYYLPKEITFADLMSAMNGAPHSWKHFFIALLEAYIALYMSLVCLILARQFLNSHSKAFRFISNSSYWVYIIHLPVLFYLQFLLLDLQMDLWIKFFIGSFGTLAIGLVSYLLLVKWTPIGWLLNGRKR